MDFSRRGFLNLLGVGGLGLILEDRAPIALFGSDEIAPEVIAPPQDLVARHYVVYPKTFIERVPVTLDHRPYGTVVARLTRNREPTKPLVRREGTLFAHTPTGLDTTVQNGHAMFYTAAMDLRGKFTAFTEQTLAEVNPTMRPMATLVTIVDAPIHASPRPEVGFDVVARCTQFVVLGDCSDEVNTFRHYSDHGEYPLQIPRDIDMGMLLRMDKQVIAAGANTVDRVRRTLITGWRA